MDNGWVVYCPARWSIFFGKVVYSGRESGLFHPEYPYKEEDDTKTHMGREK